MSSFNWESYEVVLSQLVNAGFKLENGDCWRLTNEEGARLEELVELEGEAAMLGAPAMKLCFCAAVLLGGQPQHYWSMGPIAFARKQLLYGLEALVKGHRAALASLIEETFTPESKVEGTRKPTCEELEARFYATHTEDDIHFQAYQFSALWFRHLGVDFGPAFLATQLVLNHLGLSAEQVESLDRDALLGKFLELEKADKLASILEDANALLRVCAPYISVKTALAMLQEPYQDGIGLYAHYKEFLLSCIELYYNQGTVAAGRASDVRYYAPYHALCQSSGYGKTRLTMQLGQDFVTVFTCLRMVDDEGSNPPRSLGAEYFLSLRTREEFLGFYRAFFECFWEYCSDGLFEQASRGMTTPTEPFHSQISRLLMDSRLDVVQRFWKQVQAYASARPRPLSGIPEGERDFVKEVFYFVATKEASSSALAGGVRRCGGMRPFVFVLDEAGALLRMETSAVRFLEWRQAIRELAVGYPVFFVLTDTTSRVVNFAPAAHLDRSPQVSFLGERLFPVKYLLPTIGLVSLRDHPDWNSPRCAQAACREMASLIYYPLQYLALGRALFNSEFRERALDLGSYGSMLRLAEEKLTSHQLLNGETNVAKLSWQYMAINACRLPLYPADSTVSEVFVSRFMATLLHVNEARTVLTSAYVPEAPLQEAAASLVHSEARFEIALEHLRNQVRSGQFSVSSCRGDLGELVAAAALLRAHDVLVARPDPSAVESTFYHPRPVDDFVRALLGEQVLREVVSLVPRGYLAFSKWYRVEVPLSQRVLWEAFRRRIALVCRPNERGVDLVIPIVGVKPEGVCEATEKEMIPLMIQVKNLAGSISVREATLMARKLLEAGAAFPASLNVIMQVGNGKFAGERRQGGAGVFTRGVRVPGKPRAPRVIVVPSLACIPPSTLSLRAQELLESVRGIDTFYSSLEEQDRLFQRTQPSSADLLDLVRGGIFVRR